MLFRSEEIVDLFDARICIELNALELALKKGISTEDLNILAHLNERMDAANRENHVKEQFFYDQKFHDKLVEISHNTRLIKFNESLLLQLNRMRVISYLERSYQQKAYNDHAAIIDYLKKEQYELVSVALREHIESTKVNYIN